MTCGPWKPISLEVYSSKIVDLHARPVLDESLEMADVEMTASVDGDASFVKFELYLEGRPIAEATVKVSHKMIPLRVVADCLRWCLELHPQRSKSKTRRFGGHLLMEPNRCTPCGQNSGIIVW